MLQLAGGNDGLNTVVPYEDDHYGRNRTTLRLAGDRLHKIGSSLGFHPEMREFYRLFHEGTLSVVQGVGYPAMKRDHGAAMRNWQTGLPETAGRETGWLGRAADQAANPDSGDVPAVFVGRIPQPLTIRSGRVIVPTLHTARDWTSLAPESLKTPAPAAADALLDYAARTAALARSDAAKVAAVLKAAAGPAYPPSPLAQDFRTVSQLIRADVGIRIYLVEQGGVAPGSFDNHSNQAGNHAVLLRDLAVSVAAFCDDLKRDGLLERVLLMTFSEFGRTLSENGRHGTGHGAAAPVFLAGGKLKGGLIGAHPPLSDLDADAPKPHTDFRSVYATALDTWLGLPSEPVLGRRFPPLAVLSA